MKNLLILSLTAATLGLGACSKAQPPAISAPTQAATQAAAHVMDDVKHAAMEAMDVKTKAVLIYADWCGSCKILDPKVQSIQAKGPMPGLEFIKLDYTSKDDADFYAQADAAGVGKAMRDYLAGTVKTGQLILVDMDDQLVRGKVTKADEPAQIVTALKDAIAAS